MLFRVNGCSTRRGTGEEIGEEAGGATSASAAMTFLGRPLPPPLLNNLYWHGSSIRASVGGTRMLIILAAKAASTCFASSADTQFLAFHPSSSPVQPPNPLNTSELKCSANCGRNTIG